MMPLHELYNNKAKQKLDPSNDHSSASKNDLFELVWENGQISMQGQSSKARKIPTCKSLSSQCLPSHSPGSHDKEVGYTNTKMGRKFGDLDAQLTEMNLSQDEEVMIPWLNYGMDDSFQHDYSSNFLHELSGVTMNELVTSNNNFSLLDRRSKQGTPPSTSQLYQPLSSIHQCQTSFGSNRSRVLDVAENNTNNDATQHAPCGEITQIPPSSNGFSTLKMERHGQVMSSNSSTSTIMNFSHFAKPVAIVKANLQNIALTPSRSESVGIKNKGEAANRSNLPESTKVDLSGECPKKQAVQSEQVVEPSKVDLKTLEPKSCEQDAADCNKFDPACQEDASKIDQTSNIFVGESGRKRREAAAKSKEPAVVSSSVCSDNGAERGFNALNQNLKRKSRDTEESDCHSEDVEEESVGVKKAASARGMGFKRSRSAEVHNLSERKRRDRINERMRALQELIPNCNKADKASMLDEAIEYLKTLQLQLQIMSMGAGLYMPTMMLPMGMQHIHTPHMAPFSPMSVGMQMGLGMGYGMGMPDVNDGPSRFPMVQVPQMQATHHPVPHTSGPIPLHSIMARPNPQVFGIPGQGLPMQMPRAPVFPFPAENLMNPSAPGIDASGTAGVMGNVDLASGCSLKDPLPNVNSQVLQNNNGCNSANQMLSTQSEARTGGFEHSTMALNSGHVSSANDRGAVNPGKEDYLVFD